MKKTFLYLIIFLVSQSCQGQKLGETLNLESISMSFDIDEFYGDEIEMYRKYEQQKDEIINGKKEEDFGDSLIKFWDFRHIRVDTIRYRDNEIINDPYRIIGITYDMTDWSDDDSIPVARYKNLNFETLNMIKSLKGEFMALYARNEDSEIQIVEFENLLSYLIGKYGVPDVSKGESFATKNYIYFKWLTDDRLVYIASDYNNKKYLNKVGIDTSTIMFPEVNEDLVDTQIFIANRQMKDSILGRLNSNGWYHLK